MSEPGLREMNGARLIEIELADGRTVEVQPVGLWHLEAVEEQLYGELTVERLKTKKGMLALLTALLDEGDHLGVPETAVWIEKRKACSRLIDTSRMAQLAKALSGGLPSDKPQGSAPNS